MIPLMASEAIITIVDLLLLSKLKQICVIQIGLKFSHIAYHEVFSVVMKNCDPFVLGPAFAIERRPKILKKDRNFNFRFFQLSR